MKKYDVLGLGNPIIDIIIHVPESFLKELELKKGGMDLVTLGKRKKILDHCQKQSSISALGGACANSMAMISQLGGKAAYSGKLGDDSLGEDYESRLKGQGVISLLKKDRGATGGSVILVTPDAERTMSTYLGMSQNFSPEDLETDAIINSRYIYVEGYLWNSPEPKAAVMKALKQAESGDAEVSFSLSDVSCVENYKDEFDYILSQYVDIVFCNEAEAAALSGSENPEKQLRKISEKINHVIVTRGAKGADILYKNEIVNIKPFKANPVDSTGAGDAFAAGYLYGLSQNYSPEQAGILASRCAAVIVEQNGPRYQGDLIKKVSDYLLDKTPI